MTTPLGDEIDRLRKENRRLTTILKQMVCIISDRAQYPDYWPGDIDPVSIVFANALSALQDGHGGNHEK